MLKKFFHGVSSKVKRIACGLGAAVGACASIAVSACAESSSSDIESVVSSAGETLKSEFVTLVGVLVPILVGIAVVGLSLYAIIYLFKMAKKFFGEAAGN